MKELLVIVLLLVCSKTYSQLNKITGTWYFIDDSTHKYAVDVNFKKDSSFELTLADIPTTHYDRTHGTFKIIKDTLCLYYSKDSSVNKIKFIGDNIFQTLYLKGTHFDLIDNKTFFKRDLPRN